jgi:uncharacterized radical SAM protein YgiQ
MTRSTLFLPMTREELRFRNWDEIDVLLITGDDYFDSPTHGTAVIGRVLEADGYRVAIMARPDWTDIESLKRLGTPKLFVGISAGAVDSTLNNYTADLAPRKTDAYAASEKSQRRPNFATAVYCGAVKSAFPGVPVVLGGVEASTRRFAYYDYLKKAIRRSVLVDTRADILVYGSGEATVLEIACKLVRKEHLDDIPGTAVLRRTAEHGAVALPAFNAIMSDKSLLVHQTRILEEGLGPHKSTRFTQQYEEGVVICLPPRPITSEQLDKIHALPFQRTSHPLYVTQNQKEIQASLPVRWSVIAQRGCPGGCSFCALAYHQGREVVSRSETSILDELTRLAKDKRFPGTITDVGGPTANTWGARYVNVEKCRKCKRASCLVPRICTNLDVPQDRFAQLLKKARRLPGIKHLYIASGIRHDLALTSRSFITLLAQSFTGGHLKVAPEHTHPMVLGHMRKPAIQQFEAFERAFLETSRRKGLEQYLVPYFIAGFPGCTPDAANNTHAWLRQRNQQLQQVQNFIPLPGTMAAAMYAAGVDEHGNAMYIPDARERKRQKNLLTGRGQQRETRTLSRTYRAGHTPNRLPGRKR